MQAGIESSKGRLSEVLRSGFPIFSAPPTVAQPVNGYPGGKFDPEQPWASYMVVKIKRVEGVFQVNNQHAKWTLNPQRSLGSATSQPDLLRNSCSYKKRGKHPATAKRPYTTYKYFLADAATPTGKTPHTSP